MCGLRYCYIRKEIDQLNDNVNNRNFTSVVKRFKTQFVQFYRRQIFLVLKVDFQNDFLLACLWPVPKSYLPIVSAN